MNKFQEKIKTLEGASDVISYLEYRVEDETTQIEYYQGRAEEYRDEDGNIDENNYNFGEMLKHKAAKAVYAELIEYLEKKYLK